MENLGFHAFSFGVYNDSVEVVGTDSTTKCLTPVENPPVIEDIQPHDGRSTEKKNRSKISKIPSMLAKYRVLTINCFILFKSETQTHITASEPIHDTTAASETALTLLKTDIPVSDVPDASLEVNILSSETDFPETSLPTPHEELSASNNESPELLPSYYLLPIHAEESILVKTALDNRKHKIDCHTVSSSPVKKSTWISKPPLSMSGQAILLSKQWVNDSIVNACHFLLKKQSKGKIASLNNTLTLGRLKPISRRPFVQILFVDSHWVTVSNINCVKGSVYVYDSLPHTQKFNLKLKLLNPPCISLQHPL